MATKKDITEAAFYLFAAKGFHETSMEDLAEALGIKKQSLYSHFKSKTEIIMSVMQIQAEKIKAELDHLIRTHCTQPIEQLLKFFFIRMSVYFAHRETLLLWKRIYLYSNKDALQDFLVKIVKGLDGSLHSSLSELLTQKCAALRSPERLDAFLLSYMVMLQGFLDVILMIGYRVDMAEHVWDSFWNGAQALLQQPV